MARGKFEKPHASGKKSKALRNTLIIIASVTVVALVVVLGFHFGLFGSHKDGRIAQNVYVAGVDVGGLTKDEAVAKVQSSLDENYTGKNMNITLLQSPQELFHATIEEVKIPTGSILDMAATSAAPAVDLDALEEAPEETQPEIETDLLEETQPVEEAAEERPDGKNEYATLELLASDAQFSLDVTAAVNAAYSVGRDGPAAPSERMDLDISEYLQCDQTYVQTMLDQVAQEVKADFVASAIDDKANAEIEVEDEDGNVSKKKVDALAITVGAAGCSLDTDELYHMILEAYGKAVFDIEFDFSEEYPEVIDLDALMQKYGKEPVNATYDEDTFVVTKETLGFGFDKKTVLEQLEEAKPGDIVTVPLTDLEPPITEELLSKVLFADVLGSYDSPHTYNNDRTHNLELACAAIDGTILKPGDVFSFNNIVGERTREKGYREATAYVAGGGLKEETGGGICQVASTLYICALQAEMEILSRAEHMYMVTYCPNGLDATIYWGSLDFKFRNTSDFPIRIEASVSDGYVHFKLIGTETRDYTVQLKASCTEYHEPVVDKENNRITGNYCIYKSYIYRYDADGNEISHDYIATSRYMIQHTEDLEKQLETESTEESSEEESSETNPTDPPETDPTDPPETDPTDPPETDPTDPPIEP